VPSIPSDLKSPQVPSASVNIDARPSQIKTNFVAVEKKTHGETQH
jgi:hypothetical protein